MDKIILGLLMIKRLTAYELRSIIETNFTSMCSNSMGSIQAAIKKLLEQGLISYEEFVENSVNKKAYMLTPVGKDCFLQWSQTAMTTGKAKDMELSKLFFMGFVSPQKRLPLIEAYLQDLKQERAELESIKAQDVAAAKLNYISYIGANSALLERMTEVMAGRDIEQGVQEISDFQMLTLQLGIDRINFDIQWFEKLKATLVDGCQGENKHEELL